MGFSQFLKRTPHALNGFCCSSLYKDMIKFNIIYVLVRHMSKKAWTLLRSARKLLKIEQESTNFVMVLAKVVPVGRACPANWVVVMLFFPQRPSLSPRAPMWSQWQGEQGHILCREQESVSAQPVVPVGMGEVLGLSKQFCCHSSGRAEKSLWGLGHLLELRQKGRRTQQDPILATKHSSLQREEHPSWNLLPVCRWA